MAGSMEGTLPNMDDLYQAYLQFEADERDAAVKDCRGGPDAEARIRRLYRPLSPTEFHAVLCRLPPQERASKERRWRVGFAKTHEAEFRATLEQARRLHERLEQVDETKGGPRR